MITKSSVMWCLGIPKSDINRIRDCLIDHQIQEITPENLIDSGHILQENPCLLWININELPLINLTVTHPEFISLPKVLVFDEQKSIHDLDFLIDSKAQYFSRLPLVENRIYEITGHLQNSINSVSNIALYNREFSLYQELLEKKTEAFNFVHDFITSQQQAESITELLMSARENLAKFFPLRSMHSIFWTKANLKHKLELFLDGCSPEGSTGQAWTSLILEKAKLMFCDATIIDNIETIQGVAYYPHASDSIILPLQINGQNFGLLVLDSKITMLSKDQATAVNTCLNHLAHCAQYLLENNQNYEMFQKDAYFSRAVLN